MRDPLFLHHLDAMSHRGCMNPHCDHTLTDALYVTSRCHEDTGLRVDYAPDRPDLSCGAVLRLRCRRCARLAVEIALRERVVLTPTCLHGRALDVLYQDGSVTVMCRRCQAPQGTADVAPYVPV